MAFHGTDRAPTTRIVRRYVRGVTADAPGRRPRSGALIAALRRARRLVAGGKELSNMTAIRYSPSKFARAVIAIRAPSAPDPLAGRAIACGTAPLLPLPLARRGEGRATCDCSACRGGGRGRQPSTTRRTQVHE